MTFDEMKNVNIRTVDPATLVSANSIVIDINLPVPARMAEFKRQTGGNVHFIKSCRNGKEIVVEMAFSAKSTQTATDCMTSYLRTV